MEEEGEEEGEEEEEEGEMITRTSPWNKNREKRYVSELKTVMCTCEKGVMIGHQNK